MCKFSILTFKSMIDFRNLWAKDINDKTIKQEDSYHREKPIPTFIDEVTEAIKKYKIDFIYFTDESFLSMRKDRLEEFFDAYEKIKLPFFIETRVETVKPGFVKRLESEVPDERLYYWFFKIIDK